jgi:hypothetical protein
MSTTFLFYIVKGFGLIKRGMRVKRKCNHFKCNQGFSSKAAWHKKKKTYLSTYLISAGPVLTLCLAHSHCDKKYVNLNKWHSYQNFYFRQKSKLILVQNSSSSQVQQISSRSTECIFTGPRIDLMSTTFLFYIVKGFGLIKRGMRVKRKCNHFKCNQGTLCELVSNRKSSSPSSSPRESVISTCYPRFKNMKWLWQ